MILTRDEVIAKRTSLTIAPVTTTIRGIDVEVPLSESDGVSRASVANLDNILTVDKSLLEHHITTLAPHKMLEVERAIHFALALTT